MKPRFGAIPKTERGANVRRAARALASYQQASALHGKGYLAQAQALCEDILKTQPKHFDALHLLGVIAAQTNNYRKAVDLIGRAIEICPDNAAFYSNRGNALAELRQFSAAVESFNKAVAIKPDFAEAYSNRGNALKGLKQLDAAVESFNKAVAIRPAFAEAYKDRGNALVGLRQFAAAVDSFDRAIAVRPGFADACRDRGNALFELKQLEAAVESFNRAIAIKPDFAEAYSNRGNVLIELKQLEAAVESFNRAISINPNFSEAYYNRGNALVKLRKLEAAVESFDKAIAIRPDFVAAHYNRGNALKELKQHDAAIESFNKVIAIEPDFAEAYNNRGNTLKELQQLDLAIESFDRAIAIKPDFADAYWNKSLTLLMSADFSNGWELYEWRWKCANAGKTAVTNASRFAKDWDGQELKGSLLVLPEQGIGDEIFYSGMLNDLRLRAESITVGLDRRLVKLYERSFENMTFVAKESINPGQQFDAQVYMPSLGRFFRNSTSALGGIKVPYLRACPGRVDKLRVQTRSGGRLICGLSWSSKNQDIGADKSFRLKDLGAILSLPDVDFVDLQYGDTIAEQTELFDATGISLRRVTEIDNFNDIDGLAALIGACDVVVTVSNTTAHLAAALGKPVFVILRSSAELLWYWHVRTQGSLWYPNARLFRQEKMERLDGVLERVGRALQSRMGFI